MGHGSHFHRCRRVAQARCDQSLDQGGAPLQGRHVPRRLSPSQAGAASCISSRTYLAHVHPKILAARNLRSRESPSRSRDRRRRDRLLRVAFYRRAPGRQSCPQCPPHPARNRRSARRRGGSRSSRAASCGPHQRDPRAHRAIASKRHAILPVAAPPGRPARRWQDVVSQASRQGARPSSRPGAHDERHARRHLLGREPVVETGDRRPCRQIAARKPRLQSRLLRRRARQARHQQLEQRSVSASHDRDSSRRRTTRHLRSSNGNGRRNRRRGALCRHETRYDRPHVSHEEQQNRPSNA